MSKRRDPDQLLLDLAQKEGPDVVHLPYTPEFEAVCQQLNPAATLEDKHRFWETLLVEADPSSTGGASATQVPPATTPNPEPAALPTSPPPQTSRPHETSGSLFPIDPIDEAIPDLQPWSTPAEAGLPPEQAQRRQKMLADIANSYLNHRAR